MVLIIKMSLDEDDGTYWEYIFDSSTAQLTPLPNNSPTDWPVFGFALPIRKLLGWKLLEAIVPYSWYVIDDYNNTFEFTESANGATTTVTIPPGNYDVTSITNLMGILINAASAANGNSFLYVVTYDPHTNKLSIGRTTGSGTFTLTFGTSTSDDGTTNPRLWLGFLGGPNVSNGTLLEAPNTLNLQGPQYVFLNSSTFGRQALYALPQTSLTSLNGGLGTQIAHIPVGQTQPGQNINYSDQSHAKWFYTPIEIMNQLDFYFTLAGLNQQQVPLRFNGPGFVLRVAFKVGIDQPVRSTVTSQKRIRIE